MNERTILLSGVLLVMSASGGAAQSAQSTAAVPQTAPLDQAAPAPTQQKGWIISVTPYVWAVNLDGTLEVKGNSTDFNKSFGELLEDLSIAGMAHFEAGKGSWSGFVDTVYAKLDTDAVSGTADVTLTSELFITDFGLYRRFGPRTLGSRESWGIDAMVGGRYYSMHEDLDSATLPDASDSMSWGDLITGARYLQALGDQFQLLVSADVGGFGLGSSSSFAWNASALFGWEMGKSTALWFGYRALDVSTNADARIDADIRLGGPMLGFEFRP